MKISLAFFLILTWVTSAFAQEPTDEEGLEKKLEESLANYYLNELNIGDYSVRFAGKLIRLSDSRTFATTFNGLTAVRGDRVRIEGFTKDLNVNSVTKRHGLLKSGSVITVVDGVDKDVQPRELSDEEKKSLSVRFSIDPFRLIHTNPNGIAAGDANALRPKSVRFQRSQLIKVFDAGDDQVGGIWQISKEFGLVQIVRFANKEMGMMPVLSEFAKVKKSAKTDNLSPDDVEVWSSVRLIWHEPKPGIYLPILADLTTLRTKDDESYAQLAMEWDLDPTKELFTKENLLSFHRSADFNYVENPEIKAVSQSKDQ